MTTSTPDEPEVWTQRVGGERVQLERGEDGQLYWPQGVTSGWVDPNTVPVVRDESKGEYVHILPAEPVVTSTLTVAEFIEARIAEKAKTADLDENLGHISGRGYAQALAECAAMRQMVERAAWVLANPTKVSHDDFCRARDDLFDLADIWSDHPDHVWGGVIRITQQSYDEAMAILDAEDKRL